MNSYSALGGFLGNALNEYNANQQAQHMNKVFAANPEFAQNYYNALQNQKKLNLLAQEQQQKQMSGAEDPSSLREWYKFNAMSPEDQARYLQMKRGDQIINMGGTIGVRSPIGGISEQYAVTPKQSEMPSFQGDVTTAKEMAQKDVEKQFLRPKAEAALNDLARKSETVSKTVDNALKNISIWSTGYGNWALSGLPNTDARALNNDLETIKANIGFDTLQNMRANSPTGGALGNVSDTENKLLQAVNGALDPLQAEKLKENLQSIKELYPQVLSERKAAFAKDFGGKYVPDKAPNYGEIPPMSESDLMSNPAAGSQSPPMPSLGLQPPVSDLPQAPKTIKFEDLPK